MPKSPPLQNNGGWMVDLCGQVSANNMFEVSLNHCPHTSYAWPRGQLQVRWDRTILTGWMPDRYLLHLYAVSPN